MRLAKCKTMSHFLRKCVLEKKIYQVDLQGLLYNATSNINQIAKRVNSTGIIYSDGIDDMKKTDRPYFKRDMANSLPDSWENFRNWR